MVYTIDNLLLLKRVASGIYQIDENEYYITRTSTVELYSLPNIGKGYRLPILSEDTGLLGFSFRYEFLGESSILKQSFALDKAHGSLPDHLDHVIWIPGLSGLELEHLRYDMEGNELTNEQLKIKKKGDK